jgi:hypothetical protein
VYIYHRYLKAMMYLKVCLCVCVCVCVFVCVYHRYLKALTCLILSLCVTSAAFSCSNSVIVITILFKFISFDQIKYL